MEFSEITLSEVAQKYRCPWTAPSPLLLQPIVDLDRLVLGKLHQKSCLLELLELRIRFDAGKFFTVRFLVLFLLRSVRTS